MSFGLITSPRDRVLMFGAKKPKKGQNKTWNQINANSDRLVDFVSNSNPLAYENTASIATGSQIGYIRAHRSELFSLYGHNAKGKMKKKKAKNELGPAKVKTTEPATPKTKKNVATTTNTKSKDKGTATVSKGIVKPTAPSPKVAAPKKVKVATPKKQAKAAQKTAKVAKKAAAVIAPKISIAKPPPPGPGGVAKKTEVKVAKKPAKTEKKVGPLKKLAAKLEVAKDAKKAKQVAKKVAKIQGKQAVAKEKQILKEIKNQGGQLSNEISIARPMDQIIDTGTEFETDHVTVQDTGAEQDQLDDPWGEEAATTQPQSTWTGQMADEMGFGTDDGETETNTLLIGAVVVLGAMYLFSRG